MSLAPHPDHRALSVADLLGQRDRLVKVLARILELQYCCAEWGLPADKVRRVRAAFDDARAELRAIEAQGPALKPTA